MRDIYLITNSSLSNTISNTLWLNRNKSEENIYVILNFQKYNKKELCYINKIYKKTISSNNYYLLNLWNNFQKISLFFCIYLVILIFNIYDLIFKKNNLKLNIVQPRFRWLSERFKFLGKLLPSFNTILIGDGLSSECLMDSPPWVHNNLVSYSRLGAENVISSYYLYSIYPKKGAGINSKRFKKAELRNTLKNIQEVLSAENKFKEIYKKINFIKKNYRKIFIFTTSTFWEYKRLDLDSEIDLYLTSLKSLLSKYDFDNLKDFIILKFHPATNQQKIKLLKNKIDSSIKAYFTSDIYLDKLLLEFPLELLLFELEDKNEVIINGISTGIIASSYIYKNLKIELGFGLKLVRKYFKTKELEENRMKQEHLISKLIKDYPN